MSDYKAYSLNNFRSIPQLEKVDEEIKKSIEVVGNVLPFKTNSYVINELINWDNIPNDPMFILTFPQKGMLSDSAYNKMKDLLATNPDKQTLKAAANEIRESLNPHPAGQLEHNVPEIDGVKLTGMQHKYKQTVLFFPSNGQTCHAYCTFCFRWPQFVGMDELKFAMRETELLTKYLEQHTEVTDLLFTGGDPMIMRTKQFATYIDPILEKNIPNLQTIRIGTKALGYWPYRFTTDADADDMLRLFEKVIKSGRNLAIMAHFNHTAELETKAVKEAIERVRSTGAQIRTQSPLLKHINDSSEVWANMWRKQVNLNCIPYYMFLARDTGAQDYFAVTLDEAWNIFQGAYQKVSGVCRTVRGPSMSCNPGKVQVLGTATVNNEKIFVLRFIQGRNPDWVARPFFAKHNNKAIWLDDLQPAFGENKFFFERELEQMYHESLTMDEKLNFE